MKISINLYIKQKKNVHKSTDQVKTELGQSLYTK